MSLIGIYSRLALRPRTRVESDHFRLHLCLIFPNGRLVLKFLWSVTASGMFYIKLVLWSFFCIKMMIIEDIDYCE